MCTSVLQRSVVMEIEAQHIFPLTEQKSKTIGCNGYYEPQVLMSGDDLRSERNFGYVSLAECLKREKASEETTVQVCDMSIDVLFTDNQGEGADIVTAAYVPLPEFEVVRERDDTHSEEPIVDIEHPETIVCFKNIEKQIVKDISIDEGIDSSVGVLPRKDEEDGLMFLAIFSNGEELTKVSKGIKESDGSQSLFVNRNPFLVDAQEVEIQRYTVSEDVITSGVESDDLSGVMANGHVLLQDSEVERESHSVHLFGIVNVESTEISEADADTQTLHSASSGHDYVHNQLVLELPESSTLASGFNGVSTRVDGPVNSLPVDQQNIKTSPTSNIIMPLATVEEKGGITGPQPAIQAKMGEMNYNHPTTSRNPFLDYGHTDASVYGPHALSDRMNYTGIAPYSGSISLRSDSSTTSTRSFAFPILQSEWNSSPVKMAKADHRHYRKYQGWRSRLLCCRF